jgi:hypothetical protein
VGAATVSGKWRGMESAPKDGSPILVCWGEYSRKEDMILHPWRCPLTAYWGTFHPNSPGKPCWRNSQGEKLQDMSHWMPLPEPPK